MISSKLSLPGSKLIGFSIKANNILNVTTPFWNGYEEMGINFNLGLNYIF